MNCNKIDKLKTRFGLLGHQSIPIIQNREIFLKNWYKLILKLNNNKNNNNNNQNEKVFINRIKK